MTSSIATYHLIYHLSDLFRGVKGIVSDPQILAIVDGACLPASTNHFLKNQRPGLVPALLPGFALLFYAQRADIDGTIRWRPDEL